MQNYLMNYWKRVKIILTKTEDRNTQQENRKMKIESEREKGNVNGRTAVTKLYNEATVF